MSAKKEDEGRDKAGESRISHFPRPLWKRQ